MPNYSVRYSTKKKHKKKCRRAHTRTHGVCVVCLSKPSHQVHHSSYRKSGDRYGINIFPVCLYCHRFLCHSPKNWVIHPTDPVWKNRNTPEFTKLLQINYQKAKAWGSRLTVVKRAWEKHLPAPPCSFIVWYHLPVKHAIKPIGQPPWQIH